MYLCTHYVYAKFRPDQTQNVATRGRCSKTYGGKDAQVMTVKTQ